MDLNHKQPRTRWLSTRVYEPENIFMTLKTLGNLQPQGEAFVY